MAASPPLCHWIGLDGCPMFDKLWHPSLCAVAPVPLGRLAQSGTSLSESFCIFVSLPSLLLFLTFRVWRGGCVGAAAVWEGASRVTNGSALVCSSVGYFPNRAALCKFLPFLSVQLVCPLCLSSVCCRSPRLQDHLSVSQLVSV